MDSKVVSVFRERMLLDVVDDAWMQDCLSDDGASLDPNASSPVARPVEIEIPLGLDLNAEDGGSLFVGPGANRLAHVHGLMRVTLVLPGLRTERTERWTDLGLELFEL
ncbi:hypothetical protein ACHHYP_16539 [Achlya hypogyna]|uniref:Uncharacterized protein n=1 Tax=Achlya hypogyna TaxID=1202772 RepID=A0A1V9ZDZ3_ACHHY|nr:hypothetical protein ACHHYP_16539 [Achlya hypogyna]